MCRAWWSVVLAAAAGGLVGCGGGGAGGLVPVRGTVTVDGKPGHGAVVTFTPQGDTKGTGGTGTADPDGRYEAVGPQGQKGLPPGQYKVTVSRRLNPDGSVPDPSEPPIDSRARETLPAKYTDPDKTELSATVGPDAPHDFKLTGGKK